MRKFRFLRLAALAACLAAQDPAIAEGEASPEQSAVAKERIEQERVRAAVAGYFDDMKSQRIDPVVGIERLVALGPPVVPYLEAELTAPGIPLYLVATLVLGRIPTDDSEAALRRAVEAADAEVSDLALRKKACACVALAMQGKADSVDLLNRGRIRAAGFDFYEQMNAVDLAAIFSAPQSIPLLEAQLDRYATDPESSKDLSIVLTAMGRLGEASLATKILPFLKHESQIVRMAAARSLARIADPRTFDPLVAALADREPHIRLEVARAIHRLGIPAAAPVAAEHLDVETHVQARAVFYEMLADLRGESAIDTLRRHWGRPDPLDRAKLAAAVAKIGSAKGLNLSRAALRDPETLVALSGAAAVAKIGGAGATDTLLATVSDPRFPVAQSAIESLVKLGDRRAASRVSDRLLGEYLSRPLTDASRFADAFALGKALEEIRYTSSIDALAAKIALQTDGTISGWLDGLVRRLSAIRENGDDRKKWSAAADSEDEALRRLAYRRLGEIGGSESAEALDAILGRADPEEAPAILEALGATGSASAMAPIERVLLDPAYDATDREALRTTAAWAARRLSGERMIRALRDAARRRDGADVAVLVYLAVLEGKESAPEIRSYRRARLARFDMRRGAEQDDIDRIVRDLEAGRSIEEMDAPPVEVGLLE